MNCRERFLAACRCEPVDRPPVWVMRQAGRYLPEYREHRAAHEFLDVCHTPSLAADVTMMPLDRYPELDAGIIFSDILVVPEAMGIAVSYPKGGPQMDPIIRTVADLDRVRDPDIENDMGYVGAAIAEVKRRVGPDKPILGFSGAPFTLACYMTQSEKGDRGHGARMLMQRDPDLLEALIDRLTPVVIEYLRMQIEHGADAVQLFDTWAGELAPGDYDRFCARSHRHIFEGLADFDVPRILFVNGAAPYLERMAASGAEVLGLDWRVDPEQARARVGDRIALQGNLDPLALYGPPARIAVEVLRMHERFGARGHIFNLGHGVLPDTPVEGVAAFVETVAQLGE